MLTRRNMSRVKRVLLTVMAMGCGTVSTCGLSLKDVRHNVAAGTATFIADFTVEFWDTLVPTWGEILNSGND